MSALNLHLGDNADFRDGEFANVTYVGLRVSLPMRMSNPSEKNQLIIHTSAIRPWPTGKPIPSRSTISFWAI
jgi:hypothetical protein